MELVPAALQLTQESRQQWSENKVEALKFLSCETVKQRLSISIVVLLQNRVNKHGKTWAPIINDEGLKGKLSKRSKADLIVKQRCLQDQGSALEEKRAKNKVMNPLQLTAAAASISIQTLTPLPARRLWCTRRKQ